MIHLLKGAWIILNCSIFGDSPLKRCLDYVDLLVQVYTCAQTHIGSHIALDPMCEYLELVLPVIHKMLGLC